MLKSSPLQKTGSLPTHEVCFRQKTPMGSLHFTLQPPCTASCPLFSVSQALMLPPQLSLKASHAFAEKHEQHKRQLVKTISHWTRKPVNLSFLQPPFIEKSDVFYRYCSLHQSLRKSLLETNKYCVPSCHILESSPQIL